MERSWLRPHSKREMGPESMSDNRTANPVALRIVGGKPPIKQPSGGVVAKQSLGHTEADSGRDLAKQRKSAAS